MDNTQEPAFWFERFSRRLKLPFWLGALVLTAVVTAILDVVDSYVSGSLVLYDIVYTGITYFFLLATAYIGQESLRALDYAESIGSGTTARMRTRIFSTVWTLVIFVPLDALFYVSFFPDGIGLVGLFGSNFFHISFLVFISSATLWAFTTSMKALYDVGKAPLRLRSFTEDKTLGLRPFGLAALRLVSVYEIGVFAVATPSVNPRDFWQVGPNGLPLYAAVAALGFLFFFLPLISFRGLLRKAKAVESGWIGPRYVELVGAMKSSESAIVDEKVSTSLAALDKVQKDVQQIHEWPFDIGLVARLTSVTVIPLAVTVIAREIILVLLRV